MKFSEQWLREWVNPAISTEALAAQLTMAGLEVEAIEPVAGAFDKVVVGRVSRVSPHPDADKLRVCEVDVGQGAPLTIVCGAANVRQDMRAPTALVGASLPGGQKITKAKLRGVASFGMLCSAKELGLAEAAEGLMELPDDAPVGTALREYLQLDDVTIELSLTPNRADCLSIEGVAREVGVLNRLPVQAPTSAPVPPARDDRLEVMLDAAEDCPHYVGRIIRGIDPRAGTPLWMRERLRRSGLRSLSPVVDVTNYVLLELGQPMHAFDLAKLSGPIRARHAEEGERIVLLDGQEITLTAGTLLIADARGPQALAGIMGGRDSAVGDQTRDIFLESAYFRPQTIAGRARSYGLHTDSSHRFERGVSPQLQRRAMERATALLLSIVGGEAGPIIEAGTEAWQQARAPIALRAARLPRVLGAPVPDEEVADILQRLGMEPSPSPEGWHVRPPAYRFDVEREEDLIEEVARVYGYDRLPSRRPIGTLAMAPRSERLLNPRAFKRVLVERGYQEAITYSFVDPRLQELLDPERPPLRLANPISADLAVMRTSLWPGLLQAAMRNLNRQQTRVRLFEVGRRFVKERELRQDLAVAGLVTGLAYPEQWGTAARASDFFDLKADVEALLALGGEAERFTFVPEAHPGLHPGQSARVCRDGVPVGWLGALHPAVEQALDLAQKVLVFELELDGIERRRVPIFHELSKFPAIRRDLAVVVDDAVTAQQLRDTIAAAAPNTLRQLELFDVYKGKGIDSGRKSMAVGLTLQDVSRTLTDADVNEIVETIVEALRSRLDATLRD